MDSILLDELKESRYLRRPLKVDESQGGYARWLKKPVLKSRSLPLAQDFEALEHIGPGSMHVDMEKTVSGAGSVRLDSLTSTDKKNPSNRTYASHGLMRPLDRENLYEYNRISFWVYLDAEGFASQFVEVSLHNKGEHIMPTPGRFEGSHYVAVIPGYWQQIIWEIPDLYRDAVTGISITCSLPGSPMGAADHMSLYVDDLKIEQVEAENSRGFNLRKNAIAYCHSGYAKTARKQALTQNTGAETFSLINEKGEAVFTGKVEKKENGFELLDFTAVEADGRYTIAVGNLFSKPFAIGEDAYLSAAWKALSFFYSERCGFDVPGIHADCHLDASVKHPDGRTLHVFGGWHDAADLTQDLCNTCEIVIAMLELGEATREKNPDLSERVIEEARWGLNWIMRTRFGDGWRNGGMIMGIWTQNMTGDKDDMQCDAQRKPLQNYLASLACAKAAPFYAWDKNFSAWCLKCAREDFEFANEMFLETAKDSGSNALQSNASVEIAAHASAAATMLYRDTKEEYYLNMAVKFAADVRACQQLERRTDYTMPLHGYFYENAAHVRTVSYFHRSLEHMLVNCFAMLLETAPKHKDAALWLDSLKAYGDYLKEISTVMEPYGILPAGIYEVDNTDYSTIYHEGAAVGLPTMEEYNAEVKNGVKLNDKTYLRRFPVAYQFRGFHAPLMGKAKAAFCLARALKDNFFRDLGTRQLEYILGMNPFAMSTMYGEGYDYPPLYGGFAVQPVGAVPVGIETFENDDEPYMPMQCNCTYKEIWVHTTARVMWLIAEIYKG